MAGSGGGFSGGPQQLIPYGSPGQRAGLGGFQSSGQGGSPFGGMQAMFPSIMQAMQQGNMGPIVSGAINNGFSNMMGQQPQAKNQMLPQPGMQSQPGQMRPQVMPPRTPAPMAPPANPMISQPAPRGGGFATPGVMPAQPTAPYNPNPPRNPPGYQPLPPAAQPRIPPNMPPQPTSGGAPVTTNNFAQIQSLNERLRNGQESPFNQLMIRRQLAQLGGG